MRRVEKGDLDQSGFGMGKGDRSKGMRTRWEKGKGGKWDFVGLELNRWCIRGMRS